MLNQMRPIWFCFFWIICLWPLLGAEEDATKPAARQVVLVIWDGMRPDFVSEENTPTLWKLGQQGVVFHNNHSVYFSATNVNGVALATGMYPAHNGLIANHEFRPQIDGRKPIDVENPGVVRKGDEVSKGRYLAAPTIAELVQKAGGRSVIAAAKTVGLLHDRPRQVPFANGSVTLSAGEAWPNESMPGILRTLGIFPKEHTDRDIWTTRALIEVLWKDAVPPFSVLWLGQPDMSQHQTTVGTPEAIRAMKGSDDNLAKVLSALTQRQVAKTTDLFVVSDHGFSTIQRKIELPSILKRAGFDVTTELNADPAPGEILIVGGGGSVLFYVVKHDTAIVHRLVEFLQQSDFAGVIFTREPVEGTFPLTEAQIDTPDAPDVVMSFRWNDQPNEYGIRGMIDADWQRAAGKGTHATLSRFDMHNTLIASGPDFWHGQNVYSPTGNVDVAPTILQILQIKSPAPMDGRVLTEALVNGSGAPATADSKTIEAGRQFRGGEWRQYLRTSQVGTTVYLDEGNGSFTAAK